MRYTNEFGLFVDQAQPVNRTFAALMIKNTEHRKILNRQPEMIREYVKIDSCYNILYHGIKFQADWKVLSN